ncbi:MAG: hypothetical protein R2699_04280 [Acidimicrobiales bacterium]
MGGHEQPGDRRRRGALSRPGRARGLVQRLGNLPEPFYDDGTHLKPDGAAFYAQLIASAL